MEHIYGDRELQLMKLEIKGAITDTAEIQRNQKTHSKFFTFQ